MSLLASVNPNDTEGVKWAKLQRWVRQVLDNAGITYTMSGLLSDINVSDTEGVKFAKLGAWLQELANNITGAMGGLRTQVAMPTQTSDPGNVGEYAIDGTKFAVYVGGIGWLFYDGYQK